MCIHCGSKRDTYGIITQVGTRWHEDRKQVEVAVLSSSPHFKFPPYNFIGVPPSYATVVVLVISDIAGMSDIASISEIVIISEIASTSTSDIAGIQMLLQMPNNIL